MQGIEICHSLIAYNLYTEHLDNTLKISSSSKLLNRAQNLYACFVFAFRSLQSQLCSTMRWKCYHEMEMLRM